MTRSSATAVNPLQQRQVITVATFCIVIAQLLCCSGTQQPIYYQIVRSVTGAPYNRPRILISSVRIGTYAKNATTTANSNPKSPAFSQYTSGGPKSPAFSQYALSPRFPPPAAYRSLGDIEEASPFTPGGQRVPEPQSSFSKPAATPSFKLQAPPPKAPSATPKLGQTGFRSPVETTAPQLTGEKINEHGPVAPGEQQYDAVPIPGAYAGAAVKSPPASQTSFGLR